MKERIAISQWNSNEASLQRLDKALRHSRFLANEAKQGLKPHYLTLWLNKIQEAWMEVRVKATKKEKQRVTTASKNFRTIQKVHKSVGARGFSTISVDKKAYWQYINHLMLLEYRVTEIANKHNLLIGDKIQLGRKIDW
jgi:hypothetical protein